MLLDKKITSKYLEGLILSIKDERHANKVLRELEALVCELKKHNIDFALLDAPICKAKTKQEIFDLVLKFCSHSTAANLFFILLANARTVYLESVMLEFKRYCMEMSNVQTITVVSSCAMKSSHIKKLQASFSKMFGTKILLKNDVDESIIGGVVIKYNSYVHDSSFAGGLQKMQSLINQLN